MKLNHDELLDLVGRIDVSMWGIGDYLLRKVPESDGLPHLLDECSTLLISKGYDTFTVGTLRNVHNMAQTFSPKSRVPGLPYGVHQAAGNPTMLQIVIKLAPKGQAITCQYVRDALEVINRRHMQAIEDEQARRRAEQNEAREQKREAEEAARKARSEAERRAAAERAAAAQERLSNLARPMPERSSAERDLPDSGMFGEELSKLQFTRDLSNLKRDAVKLERDYREMLTTFTSDDADAALEDLVALAETVRRMIDRIQGRASKGGHLNVVA